MESSNISDFVRHWAELTPNQEAIIFEEQRISYAEFEDRTEEFTQKLLSMGLQKGDRIAVQLLNSPEYLILYMATLRVGAVLVGINPQFKENEIKHILGVTQPTLFVTSRLFCVEAEKALNEVPVREKVLIDGAMDNWKTWSHFQTKLDRQLPLVQEDDPAVIVFTSGTTGKSKAATLTHGNISKNIKVEVREFQLNSKDRMVLHLPMNHVAGATEISIGAIMAGATLLVMDRFHPEVTLKLVEKEKATFLGQVPAMFAMELGLPNFSEFDLSSVSRFVVAGAATPQELMKKMIEIAPVITGYGMSEAAGFVTYTKLTDSPETIAKTVGKVAPEFELKVVKNSGDTTEVGEVGEVLLRGDCMMSGYFSNEDATREAFTNDGWYRSGDLGFLDSEGYLTLVGRKKDMYISGGYNVYPAEIEDTLSKHPDVLMSACLGTKDQILGEVGKVFIVPRAGKEVSDQIIREFLVDRLAKYKVPKYLEFRENLPLNSTGKVDKQSLL